MIATLNLNGDYISDALAAQVGGIGIAPGGNLSDEVAMFEATHGTAPKYAGQDKVNPGSLILSAEMMLRHLGWVEAADLITRLARRRDRRQAGHLRLRPPDGRARHEVSSSGIRARDDRAHVARTTFRIFRYASRVPMSAFRLASSPQLGRAFAQPRPLWSSVGGYVVGAG